jgi:hypothetical protein
MVGTRVEGLCHGKKLSSVGASGRAGGCKRNGFLSGWMETTVFCAGNDAIKQREEEQLKGS